MQGRAFRSWAGAQEPREDLPPGGRGGRSAPCRGGRAAVISISTAAPSRKASPGPASAGTASGPLAQVQEGGRKPPLDPAHPGDHAPRPQPGRALRPTVRSATAPGRPSRVTTPLASPADQVEEEPAHGRSLEAEPVQKRARLVERQADHRRIGAMQGDDEGPRPAPVRRSHPPCPAIRPSRCRPRPRPALSRLTCTLVSTRPRGDPPARRGRRRTAVRTLWLRPESSARQARASASSPALGRTRRPTATTVSAARTKASGRRAATNCALAWARRRANSRGVSSFNGASSSSAGSTASGTRPIWARRSSRRGLALARIRGAEARGDGRGTLSVDGRMRLLPRSRIRSMAARTARRSAGGAHRARRDGPPAAAHAVRRVLGRRVLHRPVLDRHTRGVASPSGAGPWASGASDDHDVETRCQPRASKVLGGSSGGATPISASTASTKDRSPRRRPGPQLSTAQAIRPPSLAPAPRPSASAPG